MMGRFSYQWRLVLGLVFLLTLGLAMDGSVFAAGTGDVKSQQEPHPSTVSGNVVDYRELLAAGVDPKHARKVMADAYKYFDGLGGFAK